MVVTWWIVLGCSQGTSVEIVISHNCCCMDAITMSMSSNPGQVELGVHSTSVLSRT